MLSRDVMVTSLCVLTVAGCGGGSAETIDDIARGIKSAVASKTTYDALKYSDDLAKRDKAVVKAFCSVTTQVADNNETVTQQQYFDRITATAEENLGEYGSIAVASQVRKLRAILDLQGLNPQAARAYVHNCLR